MKATNNFLCRNVTVAPTPDLFSETVEVNVSQVKTLHADLYTHAHVTLILRIIK